MSKHDDFFNLIIFEFYKNDVESCLNVSKSDRATFPGGQNYTAGLVIVCVLETITAYYKGKDINKSGVMEEAKSDEVAEFMVKYFSPFEKLFSDKSFSKKFYEVYRHGLVHQFDPKSSAIAMDFNSDDIIDILPVDEKMVINIPPLFRISLKAYELYEADLNVGPLFRTI